MYFSYWKDIYFSEISFISRCSNININFSNFRIKENLWTAWMHWYREQIYSTQAHQKMERDTMIRKEWENCVLWASYETFYDIHDRCNMDTESGGCIGMTPYSELKVKRTGKLFHVFCTIQLMFLKNFDIILLPPNLFLGLRSSKTIDRRNVLVVLRTSTKDEFLNTPIISLTLNMRLTNKIQETVVSSSFFM